MEVRLMLRIRIIGGGSLGLLLAGKLAAAGRAQVELVTRGEEQAERICREGVTVREPERVIRAMVRAEPIAALGRASGMPEAPDWVLLTVKQHAIGEELLAALRRMPVPLHGIVCWQNGIGHLERLAANVPAERLYLAVTTEGARRLSPAEVDHTGAGTTEIGRADALCAWTEDAEEAQKKLVETLAAAGFDAVMSKQILKSVWNKLLINAAINPLTAIWRVPNGHLLQSETARELVRSLTEEALAVAAAEGIDPAADIAGRIADVCRRTAANRSSMLQDIEAGRATENEWISGALLRLAAKHGMRIPVTETVYRIVRELERGR
jgi:2-dehydropantoate 2-reductase